jgi:exosome complex component RRP40
MSIDALVPLGTHVCLPGEALLEIAGEVTVKFGSGLMAQSSGSRVFARGTLCGPLVIDSTSPMPMYSVQRPRHARYIPRVGDPVVGAVLQTTNTSYRVTIGSSQPAVLDVLGFDGASKTNRPRLKPGDTVYCHVVSCERGLDVELSCCAVGGITAKDWTTGESVFGALCGGYVVKVPPSFALELLTQSDSVLSILGERLPFEACIGVNGRIWVRSGDDCPDREARVVAIASCICESQYDDSALAVRARVAAYFDK